MNSSKEMREAKKLMKLLFLASRGGTTRAKIISLLINSPLNAHQLTKNTGLDYKTVTYHLDVLLKHKIVVKEGDGYGALYRPSKYFYTHLEVFNEVVGSDKVST
ncbi:transcriptional regulator [Sulfolobales archaeon HS-7]|nr:transcriptional regulator [Sulfolobales archaeon HS-7]